MGYTSQTLNADVVWETIFDEIVANGATEEHRTTYLDNNSSWRLTAKMPSSTGFDPLYISFVGSNTFEYTYLEVGTGVNTDGTLTGSLNTDPATEGYVGDVVLNDGDSVELGIYADAGEGFFFTINNPNGYEMLFGFPRLDLTWDYSTADVTEYEYVYFGTGGMTDNTISTVPRSMASSESNTIPLEDKHIYLGHGVVNPDSNVSNVPAQFNSTVWSPVLNTLIGSFDGIIGVENASQGDKIADGNSSAVYQIHKVRTNNSPYNLWGLKS